jgi:hypothetical protein
LFLAPGPVGFHSLLRSVWRFGGTVQAGPTFRCALFPCARLGGRLRQAAHPPACTWGPCPSLPIAGRGRSRCPRTKIYGPCSGVRCPPVAAGCALSLPRRKAPLPLGANLVGVLTLWEWSMAAPAGPNLNSTWHAHPHHSPGGAEWAGQAIVFPKLSQMVSLTKQIGGLFFKSEISRALIFNPAGVWANRLFLFTLGPSRGRARPCVPWLGQAPKPLQD